MPSVAVCRQCRPLRSLGGPEHDAIVGDTNYSRLPTARPATTRRTNRTSSSIPSIPLQHRHVRERVPGRCCHVVYFSNDGGASWTNSSCRAGRAIPAGRASSATWIPAATRCSPSARMAAACITRDSCATSTNSRGRFPASRSPFRSTVASHWDAPVMGSSAATGNFFQDKEWIGVGNDGTVYLTWTRFYQGPRGLGYLKSPIVMASSKTGGKSWSSVKEISDDAHPYNQGSQVAIAPDGTLYVAYEGATGHRLFAGRTDRRALDRRRQDLHQHRSRARLRRPRLLSDSIARGAGPPDLVLRAVPDQQLPFHGDRPSNGHIAIVWADNEGAGNCGTGGTSFIGTTSNQVKLVRSAEWHQLVRTHGRSRLPDRPDKVFPLRRRKRRPHCRRGTTRANILSSVGLPIVLVRDRGAGFSRRAPWFRRPILRALPHRSASIGRSSPSDDSFSSQTPGKRAIVESVHPVRRLVHRRLHGDGGSMEPGSAVTVWTDFRGKPGQDNSQPGRRGRYWPVNG